MALPGMVLSSVPSMVRIDARVATAHRFATDGAGMSLPRVLVADDQPDVLLALHLLLKGEGFETETADSPAAILAALERRRFDALLMDLNYTRDTTSGAEGLEARGRRLRAQALGQRPAGGDAAGPARGPERGGLMPSCPRPGSTAPEHFATLFIGCYEDATRRLRYANCGHNPPLLLRRDGHTERLAPTAPVLGLIRDWCGEVVEVPLAPGDVLLLFSDGATEARNREGEEFGDARLLEALRASRDLPADEIPEAILAGVEAFAGRDHDDDITLLAARAR